MTGSPVPGADQAPHFSVIVPTLDRPASLAATLEALAAQDLAADQFEVIVVDDGGRPPLEEAAIRPQKPLRLRIIRVEHAGPGAARNAGALLARGQILCFTDHDCRPAVDWLSRLRDAFAAHPDAGVGGRTENIVPRRGDEAAEATDAAVLHYFMRRGLEPEYLPTCNLAFPARAFGEMGGFHPGFPFAAEEREFCDRWRAAGRPLRYEPAAVVRHARDLSIAGFLRQQFRYGQGALVFARLRTRPAAGARQDHGFHVFLLGFALRSGWSTGAMATALAVCAGRASYLIGYAYECLRQAVKGKTAR